MKCLRLARIKAEQFCLQAFIGYQNIANTGIKKKLLVLVDELKGKPAVSISKGKNEDKVPVDKRLSKWGLAENWFWLERAVFVWRTQLSVYMEIWARRSAM